MKFVDEIDCLIKKYEESCCFIATNEYGKELQKIYKQIIFDLDYLKSDYCLMNHIDKIDKFERKLKKIRKEKKRWKNKYLELSEENKRKYFELNEEAKKWKKKYNALLYEVQNQDENEWLKLKYGGGLPPIKPLNENALKPTKPIKSRVKPGSMDWLYEV